MKKQFTLLKLHVEKKGGLLITYSENYIKDGMDVMEEITRKSNLIPTDDLINAIDAFKEEIFQTRSYADYMLLAKNDDFLKIDPKVQGVIGKLLVKVKARIMNDMKISTISMGGEDDHRWIIASGSLSNAAGMGGGINSTNIRVEQEHYGWEEATCTKIDTLVEEVQLYLSGEKTKTPEFFNEKNED